MGVRERCVLSELVCVCGAGSLDGRNQDGHKGNSSRREFLCVLYFKWRNHIYQWVRQAPQAPVVVPEALRVPETQSVRVVTGP